MGAKDLRHRANAAAGVFLLALFLLEAVAVLLGRLSIAPSTLARVIGAALAFAGPLLMFAAQMNLGASWRIGIEEGARPGLVTSGLYRSCRNPIFLFVFLTFGGLTLLLWNLPTAFAYAGFVLVVRLQVLEEERWLESTYGDDYRRYASSVGRFLPGMGRLRRS